MRENIEEGSIHLIIADPPFGINFSSKRDNYNRDGDLVIDDYIEVPSETYREFSVEWIKEAYRVLRNDGSMYVFSGWNHLEDVLYALRISGFILYNSIVWKYQFGVYTKRKFVTSHYHILFAVKNENKYYFNKVEHYPEDVWKFKDDVIRDDFEEDDPALGDVWVINRPYHKGEKKVPNKLPPRLIRKILLFSSKDGDIILDPFSGGGSVSIEIIKLNKETGTTRKCIAIEKSKTMYDFIMEQIKKV
jgi:site-specific DNA-methyltransferase (adenine-specific)